MELQMNGTNGTNGTSGMKKLRVLCPVTTKDNRTYWVRSGTAFRNRDESINLYLDVLPVNGKLQIREWDDSPSERGGDKSSRPAAAMSQDDMPGM